MNFQELFKSLFGTHPDIWPDQSPRDDFRNPIWDDGAGEDDDVWGFPNHSMGFDVFSSPAAIHKFFEQQMDEMMKHFGSFGVNSTLLNLNEDELPNPRASIPIESAPPEKPTDLRDMFLKPKFTPVPPQQEKIDVDLDSQVKSGGLKKLIDREQDELKVQKPQRFFSKSVTVKRVQKPDGTVETRKTVRDSNGNEETTITHEIPNIRQPRADDPSDVAGTSVFKRFFLNL